MNLNIKLILIVAVSATLFLLTLLNIKQKEATQTPRVITLSNTDTIYKQIEKIKLKSDTIILKYETKINTYRTANTTNKISLFADRINRQ
jgi:hypothetical protein